MTSFLGAINQRPLFFGPQQGCESGSRVDTRSAPPVDIAVAVHQRNRSGVADNGVILDPCRHDSNTPLRRLMEEVRSVPVLQRSHAAARQRASVRVSGGSRRRTWRTWHRFLAGCRRRGSPGRGRRPVGGSRCSAPARRRLARQRQQLVDDAGREVGEERAVAHRGHGLLGVHVQLRQRRRADRRSAVTTPTLPLPPLTAQNRSRSWSASARAQAPIGSHHVHRRDAVGGQPIPPGQPPHPAAKGVSRHAHIRRGPRQRGRTHTHRRERSRPPTVLRPRPVRNGNRRQPPPAAFGPSGADVTGRSRQL